MERGQDGSVVIAYHKRL